MVRVPLPQQSVEVTRGGTFQAPGVLPARSAVGPQLEQAGQTLTQAGLRVSQRAAELEETLHVAAVKEAQARAEERIIAADRAYTNLTGKEATGEGRQRANEQLRKQLEEVESTLQDERERALFQDWATRRTLKLTPRWNDHEDRQAQVWDIGVSRSLVNQKADAVRLEGADADFTPLRTETDLLARKLGLTGPEKDVYVKGVLSGVHVGIASDLIKDGAHEAAGAYLTKHEKEIEAGPLIDLRRDVERGGVQEKARAVVTKLRADLLAEYQESLRARLPEDAGLGERVETTRADVPAGLLVTAGSTRLQEMLDAGEIDSPEVRDAAIAELTKVAKIQSNQEALDAVRVRNEAQTWLRENAPAGVEDLPPDLYREAGDMGLLPELRDFAGGKGRVSNPAVWFAMEAISDAELRDMTPAELARQFGGGLSPQHISEVAARWRKARGEATPEDESILSKSDRIRMALVRNEMWPVIGDRASREQVMDRFRIEEEVQKRVTDEKRAGRSVEGEALQKIIDEVMLDRGTVPGFLSDTTGPVASFTPEEMLKAVRTAGGRQVPVIPPAERQRIEDALRDAGRPVTPEEIVRLWREAQRVQRQGVVRESR